MMCKGDDTVRIRNKGIGDVDVAMKYNLMKNILYRLIYIIIYFSSGRIK